MYMASFKYKTKNDATPIVLKVDNIVKLENSNSYIVYLKNHKGEFLTVKTPSKKTLGETEESAIIKFYLSYLAFVEYYGIKNNFKENRLVFFRR